MYTFNGVHIGVFFNTESLNERAPYFKLFLLPVGIPHLGPQEARSRKCQ